MKLNFKEKQIKYVISEKIILFWLDRKLTLYSSKQTKNTLRLEDF